MIYFVLLLGLGGGTMVVVAGSDALIFLTGLSLLFIFVGVLKNWWHLIMIMMLMEMAMLTIFFMLGGLTLNFTPLSLIFLFSSFMAIEASIGMASLALIVRSHGNDFMLIF